MIENIKNDINTIEKSHLFDEKFYISQVSCIDEKKSCIEHYIRTGATQGLNPSEAFNTQYYLIQNPDVKESGINPLIHYINFGHKEGRKPTRFHTSELVTEYDYIEDFNDNDIRLAIENLESEPLISIVMPVYNVDPIWLDLAIKSVKNQIYTNWELCIVDDSSSNQKTLDFLKKNHEGNIKIKFLQKNLHISGATNHALEMSCGEYIVFMDNDDLITRDALYEVARVINKSNPDMIYSDEDKVDESGNFFAPFFKPDWSPDTFMSIMYICHLTCYKRSVVEELGGLRAGYEGAQDYDLGLRFMEVSDKVVHIPKVLYHWRILETSIANDIASKPYAIESLIKAKTDAFKRRGLKANLIPVENFPGQYIPSYFNETHPKVSIIIPTKDKVEILQTCITSVLQKTNYNNFEIMIIDNQSIEVKTKEYFASLESSGEPIKVIEFDEEFNFSKMNNLAAKSSDADFLLFLNNDTEVIDESWLTNMQGYAALEHIGAVGAQLFFPTTMNIQHCGVLNLNDGPGHALYNKPSKNIYHFGRNAVPYNWSAVTAACLMIKKDKFDQIGGFDESFPVAYNDVDLCFSLIEAGYYNVCCNHVHLLHYESVSRGQDLENERKFQRLLKERKRLYIKHPNFYYKDRFFNRNLHPNNVNFENFIEGV